MVADLVRDRVGDLTPAVPDGAVPQARHRVDVLVAVAVPQHGSLAPHDRDELLAGRLGERMEEGRWRRRHIPPTVLPAISSPRSDLSASERSPGHLKQTERG